MPSSDHFPIILKVFLFPEHPLYFKEEGVKVYDSFGRQSTFFATKLLSPSLAPITSSQFGNLNISYLGDLIGNKIVESFKELRQTSISQ